MTTQTITTLESNSILLIYLLAFAGLAFGGYNVYAVFIYFKII